MPAWTEGLSPEENAFLATKGFDKHEDPKAGISALITSYRAAEAKLGAPAGEMIRWPADKTPDVVYERLGVPKAAEEYKFEGVPETHKPLEEVVRGVAFANKLTPAQAQAVVASIAKADADKAAAAASAANLTAQSEEIKLRAHWGGDYDLFNAQAVEQAGKMGWNEAQKAAFLSTAEGKMQLLKVAVVNAEPGAKGLGGGSTGNKTSMSPEEAAQTLRTRMNDKDWVKNWHAGDKETLAEFNALTQAQVRR